MTDDIETIGNDQRTAQKPDIDPKSQLSRQLVQHLAAIYPDEDRQTIVRRIVQVCERYPALGENQSDVPWNQDDVVLICYGDNVHDESQPTLDILSQFLRSQNLNALINILHLLPINPYTSDDGFSVVDYRQVDKRLGDWENVDALNEHFDLMLDLVLNHCSQESDWFQRLPGSSTAVYQLLYRSRS